MGYMFFYEDEDYFPGVVGLYEEKDSLLKLLQHLDELDTPLKGGVLVKGDKVPFEELNKAIEANIKIQKDKVAQDIINWLKNREQSK